MKKLHILLGILMAFGFTFSGPALAQIKIGYVNSQSVLEQYKDAQDAQKQLADINKQWQEEAANMQKEIQDLQDKLETQSLILTEEKKAEKAQEIQNLYIRFQQYQQEKWGQTGQIYQEEKRLMQPIYDKVNAIIQTIGESDGYDYIFDVLAGNILYASKKQTNLTDRVLTELAKAAPTTKSK